MNSILKTSNNPEVSNYFDYHPGNNISEVIQDVVRNHPEESFYFLNIKRLKKSVATIHNHYLPEHPARKIAYAVKANPFRIILETIYNQGISVFDCASPNEINLVRESFKYAQILYNNPIKLKKDISYSFNKDTYSFSVQSIQETEKIIASNNLLKKIQISVRVATFNKNAKISLSDKFGANEIEAVNIIRFAKSKNIDVGLCMHIGSQNTDIDAHCMAISKLATIARAEGGVTSLNIGGGIPVDYNNTLDFDTPTYLKKISLAINKNCNDIFSCDEPSIYIEIGRSIVAECVDLIVPVMATEFRNGKKCVYINDGVFTSFSDAVVHSWKYRFKALNHQGVTNNSDTCLMTVYGRTCDSGDALQDIPLPTDIKAGDFIHIEKAGAYMSSQSTEFNGFSAPKYIIYNE